MKSTTRGRINWVRNLTFQLHLSGLLQKIMLRTAVEYLQKGSRIERVIFCLYDDETYKIFEEELEKIKRELRQA